MTGVMSKAPPVSGGPSGPNTVANRGLPLRWRLILLVVAATVPLLVFVLGYQYSQYRTDIGATGARTEALARDMAALVEDELRVRIATLQTLAVSPQLQSGDLAAFRLIVDRVVAEQYPGANVQLADENGQQLMNTTFPVGAALPVRPDLISLRQVFATGNPAVSDLFQRNVGRPGVFIDVPVKRPDGTVAYVLGMNPPLDLFNEIIQRQHLPESWLFAVFDRSGTTIARYPNGEKLVGFAASPSLLPLLLAQHEGHTQNDSREGIPLVTGFSRGEQFGWPVAIGVRREELVRPIIAGALRTLGAGSVMLVIALALAIYAARRIAHPISSLRRLAASDGAVPSRPLPTGLPEVDEVALALHTAEVDRRSSRQAE